MLRKLTASLVLCCTLLIANMGWAAGILTITNDEGQPLAGVEIMIGSGPNDPFTDNVIHTNSEGQAEIPASWKSLLPITLTFNGYTRASFLNVSPQSATYQMHKADTRAVLEVKGQATQFGTLKRDGQIDFALIYPTLKRRELVRFDVGNIISPEIDEISVFGKVMSMPSNVSLPKQTETYILPITLSKPEYRMYLKNEGVYKMMATRGQFPLKQVADDFQSGKSFFEVMNRFKIMGAGTREVSVNGSKTNQDIPVNQIAFNRSIEVVAPSNIPATNALIMTTMVNDNGAFYPADFKSLTAGGKAQLFLPANSNSNFIVSLMVDKHEYENPGPSFNTDIDPGVAGLQSLFNEILKIFGMGSNQDNNNTAAKVHAASIAVHPETEVTPTLLDLIPAPQFQGLSLKVVPPKSVSGITPVATYAVLSEVVKAPANSKQADKRYAMWEALQPNWVNHIQLPQVNLDLNPAKSYRWEVLFLGRSSSHNDGDGYVLDQITHISRASLDF